MLLLSSPRCARPSLLLLLTAALLHVTTASLQAASRCPTPLECVNARRHFCETGSSRCGPCLKSHEENEDGVCVVRKRHRQTAKVYSDLDGEIDFLRSVLEQQREALLESKAATPEQKQSDQFAAIAFQSDVRTSQQHVPVQNENHAQTTAPSTGPTNKSIPNVTGGGLRVGPIVTPSANKDKFIIIMVSVCVVVGTVAVILAAICAVKLHRDSRLAQKVDYPAFGGATVAPVKANGPTFGDQTLAQNAQMFHYQHQKQQMLSLGKHKPESKAVDTDVTSDEEDVGGDFTVYECPGLAPTGEMEVKNPLFDDSTLPYQGNHK